MPRGRTKQSKDIKVEAYAHKGRKRRNNPPVGLVSSATDKLNGRTKYKHDPYIDPYLSWTGKAEGMSFDVQNVSLHIHERIDSKRIVKAFLKKKEQREIQLNLFEQPDNDPPLNRAIDFYKHEQDWTNRLIAGDSLLVMNSLLKKEGMAGKVQMVYIDPPYGIKYNSNFQPFVNKRDVKDNNDADIPAEPEMIQAFRDTWELGIHSYLTYLRDRLLLVRDLWSSVSDEKSSNFDNGKHSRRAGAQQQEGIYSVSGDSEGIACRTGNIYSFVQEIELRPRVEIKRIIDGLRRNKQIIERASQIAFHLPLITRRYVTVRVHGFDYYNPLTGEIESKGTQHIAMWFLDTDYDERSLYPDQVFFPEGDSKRDWSRLAKALNGEVNEEPLDKFSGVESIPFALGENKKIAVKIIDTRGIESLVIKQLK